MIGIAGASPDRINNNSIMRSYVVEGFRQLNSNFEVIDVPFENVVECLENQNLSFLLMFGSCMPDESDYTLIKKAAKKAKIPVAFWLHDDPFEFDMHYKLKGLADFTFTNDLWSSYHYDFSPVYHLPMAASPTAHFRPIQDQYERDLFFCGVAFSNRLSLVKDIEKVLLRYRSEIYGQGWGEATYVINRRLDNKLLSDHYNSSKFVINVGRNFNLRNERYLLDPSTPGPRTFEAAMSGCVQLFQVESLEIENYFTPGKEILLFDSVKEFSDLVDRYIASPEELLKIRKSSQERALKDHSYQQRAKKILDVIGLNGLG